MTLSEHQKNILALFILYSAGCPFPTGAVLDIYALCGVNNFTVPDNIRFLEQNGNLSVVNDGREEYAVLTAKGREVIEQLKKDIPLSVREKAAGEAALAVSKLRRDLAITVRVEEKESGFSLFTEFNDNGTVLLRLELFMPTRLQAEIMGKRFREDPVGIYSEIIESLQKNREQET